MKSFIQIQPESRIPKYKQIVQSIQNAVESGRLKQGERLPSFNYLRDQYGVSRDTVIKAYQELKALGIITSCPGKGNYILSTSSNRQHHIFLLFDELTPYKETLYNAIKEAMADKGSLDIYFHHFNQKVFDDLVQQAAGAYTDYVIMPLYTRENFDQFRHYFHAENVYILDIGYTLFGKKYPSVCQDFEANIFCGLQQGLKELRNYKRLVMIIEAPSNPSKETMTRLMNQGFSRFCNQYQIAHKIIHTPDRLEIEAHDCFLVHQDKELVRLVQTIQAKGFVPGRNIGLISFNDTPLKQIALGGITTISTDFARMGRTMAELVLNHSPKHLSIPAELIKRATL